MKDELQLYKKGAELNNGVMAGYCQYRLADMYENGAAACLRMHQWFRYGIKNRMKMGIQKQKCI